MSAGDKIPMIMKLGFMLREHERLTLGVRARLFTLSEPAAVALHNELGRIGIYHENLKDNPMVKLEQGFDFKFAGVNGRVVKNQREDILVQAA